MVSTLGHRQRIGPGPDGVVEPALVLGKGGPSHRSAPRRERVVAAVRVLLQARDGVVEGRALPDLEAVVDAPAERPGEVVLEVRIAAEAFDAVGDLQAASGVQWTCRHRVHRMQGLDKGVDIPGSLGGAQVVVSFGGFRRHPGEIRGQHEDLALQAGAEHRVVADTAEGITAQVEQDRARVLIRDPAHDQGSVREEATVIGGPGITRDLAADRHRFREQPGAEEASRPPDRQLAAPAVVASSRNLGRTLPATRCHLPVVGPLGRVGGIVKRAERLLDAEDRHGTGALLGDAREVAGSQPLQRLGRMGVRRRLALRAKAVVGQLALPGREPDEAAIDDDESLALRDVDGPEQVRRREAADVDRQLHVERVAKDGQRVDQPGCGVDVAIHRTDSSP